MLQGRARSASILARPPRTFPPLTICRTFVSDGDSGSLGGGGEGGRRGGRWRSSGDRKDNNNSNHRRPRKPNYSEQYFEPASRGELKNHRSGIPKLAGRRPKGHGVRSADPGGTSYFSDEDELEYGADLDQGFVDLGSAGTNRGPTKTGTISAGDPLEKLSPEEYQQVKAFMEAYEQLKDEPDHEPYYWNERDYVSSLSPSDQENAIALSQINDDMTNQLQDVEDVEDVDVDDEDLGPKRRSRGDQEGESNQISLVPDIFEYVASNDVEPDLGPEYDTFSPLEINGPGMDDFALAMLEHPTRYAQIRSELEHPDSTREPIPLFPKNRSNPPTEFVEKYVRYLYVSGLPPKRTDGEPTDFENPIHRHEIQMMIADLFGTEPEHVCPASSTSGFIGFESREDQLLALHVGPLKNVIESPITISKYDPSEKDAVFAEGFSDSIVLLENLPAGSTTSSLARTLFPPETDIGEVYGGLSPRDVMMKTPNSALVRFSSSEKALSAISSSEVQQRLVELGQHRVRYSRARRELIYTGKHGGPCGTERLRALGPRLIVDGDMPTKKFYLSHADVVHLRYLDPSITKEDIANFFQPFCGVKRDVEGSVEFVTCHEGLRTDRAYVGFDELGEVDLVSEAFKGGRVEGLGPGGVVIMQSVKDVVRRRREKRQTRTEEELYDNLHNWEQYVDPADIEELIANGVSKEAIDEALTSVRYNNPTFASLDQALRSETLQPEKDRGGMYAEYVRLYIETLKECIGTPEAPGEIYEGLHFQGEEIDTSIFDTEKARIEEIQKRRSVP